MFFAVVHPTLVSMFVYCRHKSVVDSRDIYKIVSKSFRTESITKWTTTINTRWKATQRVMAAKLNRLTHKIAIRLHLVVESCIIYSSHSRRPVGNFWIHPRMLLLTMLINSTCIVPRKGLNYFLLCVCVCVCTSYPKYFQQIKNYLFLITWIWQG
jgi:hypothetical protein